MPERSASDERSSLPDDLAVALERHRRAAEENAIVAEIGHAISAPGDVDVVYRRFADQIGRLIDFDRLAIGPGLTAAGIELRHIRKTGAVKTELAIP